MSAVELSHVGAASADVSEVTAAPGGGSAESSRVRRRRRYLREPLPWRRSDATRALVLAVVGAAVSGWGWFGVSGEVRLREQEMWAVVASFGTAIAACGGAYLITVAMRAVRLGQRQLMFDLADVLGWSVTVTKRGRLLLDPAAEPVTAIDDGLDDALVVGPGMTIVHRSVCPIARTKAVVKISVADAAARNLGFCGVCRSGNQSGEADAA